MPTEMPTLGAQTKKSPLPGVVITAVVVGLVAGGFYWWKNRPAENARVPEVVAPVAAVADPVAPQATPTAALNPAEPAAAVGEAKVPPKIEANGVKTLKVEIKGPLEAAVVMAAGKEIGLPLTQVINRSLVWWMKVPGDLMKGDELEVVYEERANAEPLVHAVRFTSKKFGKTFEAYRFKAKDETFARFYEPSGEELEQRLVDGPLDSWEQVTSLLKDGRKHKGVDFKTSVGTPVKATFDGTILRKNWNFRGNGNSLEIQETGGKGRVAMFLHLSELPKTVVAGQKVKKGEVIARSGNTGHSFAPHLHYQLMKNDQVIDPFESHGTYKKSVEPGDKLKLDAELARLRGLIGAAPAQVAGGFGRP